MSLPPRSTPGDWPALITAKAVTEMKGKVSIFDPANMVTVPYDPDTDEGGTSVMAPVLLERRARIQQVGPTKEYANTIDWGTTRLYRIQIDLLPGDPLLTKGLILRVTDGGKDPSLTQWSFGVLSAAGSDHAALRTIMCSTTMVPTLPVSVAP